MTERIEALRKQSFEAKPEVSSERAMIITQTYKENEGRVAVPVLRAMAFRDLCEKKTIYIGDGEIIVGERGSYPKVTPTYPELTCHSTEDFKILRSRPMTSYNVPDSTISDYEKVVIPYWRGKSVRDIAFSSMPEEWLMQYEAGMFTEFMEQRAAGHTALDGKLYYMGCEDIKNKIAKQLESLDKSEADYESKKAELEAMTIALDAAIRFAERHAILAEERAKTEPNAVKKAELLKIAEVCRQVPRYAPRNFREAVQAYWFVHLGTITELNGWDAMSPGHFDQHLAPFYEADIKAAKLTREEAKEIISAFWIKVNNTPAPPKVGVTAAESGTYNDFTNINLAGLKADGSDGSSEVTLIILEVLDELRLLQPQANVQVSSKTPDKVLEYACKVVRNGMGYPSFFNSDEVVLAQMGMGKSLFDAREGGTSGCVETGCFGKEAYVLHGYLNSAKLLVLALFDGQDIETGKQLGPHTGDAKNFKSFEDLYLAWKAQLENTVRIKIATDEKLAKIYAEYRPAPFLSSYITGCIENAKDYYQGGARYNSDYIQCTALGTVTDSLSVIKTHIFDKKDFSMEQLLTVLKANWDATKVKEATLIKALAENKTPLFGNNNKEADDIAIRVFNDLVSSIDGKKSFRGGTYRANFLSTTCHVYFGLKTSATPDGRKARLPLSDGTSPSHGADKNGPTAVMNSLGKLDQAKTGGTLLNQRFTPDALKGNEGPKKLASLIRGYFAKGGHHVQFNVVDQKTLLDAKAKPENYRNLLVRVAGYSDYFVDLDENHQDEIISRTAHELC